ncbi:MAG: sugar transferase [Bacteroidaceae bacterium]|nr:sugar transferase [Bacteroidaceae bacterium]
MSRTKHVILIGEAEELREMHDEWLCRNARIVVDACFVDDELPSDAPLVMLRYDCAAVEDLLCASGVVSEVYCSSSIVPSADMSRLCYCCEERNIRFVFVPHGLSSLHRRMRTTHRGGLTMLEPCRPRLYSLCWRILKRLADLLGSLLLLLTVFPAVYVVRAIQIKRKSMGPVLLRTKSSGPDGKVFHCLTFRRPEGQAGTRLDAMPQLLNVFFGEMSFVGMPLLTGDDIEQYVAEAEKYHIRHWPRPGLTQWSRVCAHPKSQRMLSPLENAVADDVWYVQHWTLGLDLRTLACTYLGMKCGA